ncbi:MAG: MAPEG family protein [Devosia sp.]
MLYLLGRVAHYPCYMKGLAPWRSIAFLVALIGTVVMAIPLVPHIWG